MMKFVGKGIVVLSIRRGEASSFVPISVFKMA
jgi:hypothetical protein